MHLLVAWADSKEWLAIFYWLAVAYQYFDDLARHVRFNLIHQLHGFNDAKHLARFHHVAGLHKRKRAWPGGLIEGPHNRRFHHVQPLINHWRRLSRHGNGGRRLGGMHPWRRLGNRRSNIGDDGHAGCSPLDPYFYISSFEFKLGDVLFYQEINKLFQLFLIHERLSALPELKA